MSPLRERNIDAVYFLFVLVSLRGSECVGQLRLFRPNVHVGVTHAMLIVRHISKVQQGLRLKLLVRVAFDAHAVIRPLRRGFTLRLLHRRLGCLDRT